MKYASAIRVFLFSFVNYLHAAKRWRRAGLAFAFGAALTLAMPPFDFFPLMWVCFPALIFLLQGTKKKRQAFLTGWWFAFGFLTCSLYWIADSMFVDLAHFWWAIPLAVAGLPALFAIYYGLAAAIARAIGLRGTAGAITFGLMWFVADYARGHLFTGFPWNLTGYAWSGILPVLQFASLAGIYGLSLVTSVTSTLPAALADGSKTGRRAFAASLVFLIALAGWGETRLLTTHVGTVPGVRLRIVQPDTAQKYKWSANDREADFDERLAMTSAPSKKSVTAVIWPEAAAVYFLYENPERRAEIAAHLPPNGILITGVIRRTLDENGNIRFYNSLTSVNDKGQLTAGYDKAHLVPFGEYMPFRKFLPPSVKALAASDEDFSPGPGPRTLRVPGLPSFSPLICYEAIFPGAVVDSHDRPDLMINVTNDAWYGDTIGPYQHFDIARVRAIEEGLPMIRDANTGISGVIGPLGRIDKRLGLEKKGFIDSDLPTPLFLTFYAKMGDTPVLVVFLLVAGLAFVCKRYEKAESRSK
ncbi:MAG: apolipoprotein N-acyltransferase [Alphaproteobacteria bacterium]|nr:apolipoprotein N-acyltransferase [Alphaproteobacteria bacterium]